MRASAFLLSPLVLAASVGAADPSPEPDEPNDAKAILGTWELVKAEMDGKSPPPNNRKEMKIEITKDHFIITTVGVERKEKAGYKLDPKSKPRRIDISPSDDKKTLEGIYKLEKGELTMCWGVEPGTGRPARFDEKGRVFMVFRKPKAKK